MNPETKRLAKAAAIALVSEAKAVLLRATEVIAEIPGWSPLWTDLNATYDHCGEMLRNLHMLPVPSPASRDHAQNPRAEGRLTTPSASPGAEPQPLPIPDSWKQIVLELERYPGNAPLSAAMEAICKVIAIDWGKEYNNHPPADQWEIACNWATAVKASITYMTGLTWTTMRRDVLGHVSRIIGEHGEALCAPLTPSEIAEIATQRPDLV